jgi:tetrahydromethanopterin S-methyltransferase subunit D
MNTRTWHRWLLLAASIVVGAGAVLVALALVGVPPELMEVLYLPGEPDVASADTISFTVGVTGAVMVGWGASMLYIYLDPAMLDRPRVARAFLLATMAWFVLDTLMSIALGAVINVVGNCLFLGLLLPPLAVLSSRRG